ncbi:MAG: extracellular solute-binding protein [Chloroflexi bacterium]|nr:extracellular solute-binding protein [Chloroflexota bacterium]
MMPYRFTSRRMSRRFLLSGAALAASSLALQACVAATPTAAPTAVPAKPADKPSDKPVTAPAAAGPAQPATRALVRIAIGGQNPNSGQLELAKTFMEKKPNVSVEYQGYQSTDHGDFYGKVLTTLASGQQIDCIGVCTEGTFLWAGKDVLIPLDDYVKRDRQVLQEYFDDVSPNLIRPMYYQGKLYELPWGYNSQTIYYNKKMWAEAGLKRNEKWTQNDFLDAVTKLNKGTGTEATAGRVFGWSTGRSNRFWGISIPWMFANSSDLLAPDWKTSTANDPKNVEAMQFMQDLIHKHKVALGPGAIDEQNFFGSGKLAMFGSGRHGLRAVLNTGFKKDDFDIIYWPGWKQQRHQFGTCGWSNMKQAKDHDLIWEFNRHSITKESVTSINHHQQGTSTPARRSVAHDPKLHEDGPENFKVYYNSLDFAEGSDAIPAPAEFADIERIWLKYQGLILANETTAKEGLDNTHKEFAEVLKNAKGGKLAYGSKLPGISS